tara:strand:+ start:292 stop:561 length:270 start_codon:yes stop_codon:yes gene_type:complete
MIKSDDSFIGRQLLRSGDIAQFIKIDEKLSHGDDRTVYQGIVLECKRDYPDGEITYEVLCDDNTLRCFIDHEVVKTICLIGSHESLKPF